MAENEIIERICGSCNCDEATAKEYLNDEIRHLRELQEVNDLQESDIELSCSGLGIESECMEYFTMVLHHGAHQAGAGELPRPFLGRHHHLR